MREAIVSSIPWPQTAGRNTILSLCLEKPSGLWKFTVRGIRLTSHTVPLPSVMMPLHTGVYLIPRLPHHFTGHKKGISCLAGFAFHRLYLWFYYHGWANFTSISNECKHIVWPLSLCLMRLALNNVQNGTTTRDKWKMKPFLFLSHNAPLILLQIYRKTNWMWHILHSSL